MRSVAAIKPKRRLFLFVTCQPFLRRDSIPFDLYQTRTAVYIRSSILRIADFDGGCVKWLRYSVRIRFAEQRVELSLQNIGCRAHDCHRNSAVGISFFKRSYLT